MPTSYHGQSILSTPMGPGFFIFFQEIFYEGNRGGMQKHFEVFPRRIYLKKEAGEPALRWEDIDKPKQEIKVIADDGKEYLLVEGPEPTYKQAFDMLPKYDLEEKIAEIREELQITKRKAISVIKKTIKKELKQAKFIKGQLLEEDEILALIIIMSEA